MKLSGLADQCNKPDSANSPTISFFQRTLHIFPIIVFIHNPNKFLISEKTMTGKVQWYEPKKGYGFISSDNNSLFFHRADFKENIIPSQGDELVFDISPGEKGLKAINIRK